MKTIVIVGGGFCGAIVAANLARIADAARLRVVLIEPKERIGRGVAYGTPHGTHLLNVPAGRMSAWPDQPDHFLNWLRRADPGLTGGVFVRRSRFGEYVEFALREVVETAPTTFAFEHRRDTATNIELTEAHAVVVHCASSDPIRANQVVLALGNPPPSDPFAPDQREQLGDAYISNPWNADAVERCAVNGSILLVGTGLTMVDFAVTLRAHGHNARLVAISRHGLLPQPHRNPPNPPLPIEHPLQLDQWDGRALSLLRWVREASLQTGEWREVINSLRPITPAIWSKLSKAERLRFLRHLRPYWDVHRHRMAMEVHRTLQTMIDGGALSVIAGRIQSVSQAADGVAVQIRDRGSNNDRSLRAQRIVNCTGPESDWSRVADPLAENLLRAGLISPDPLRLGILTNDDGALVDRSGRASDALFTLGHLRRGALWESTAVPELRVQAATLAKQLISRK